MTIHKETNFSTLSEKQREVLGLIAINQDEDHHPKILQYLLNRGMIRREEIKDGSLRYTRYYVPIEVHIAWCEWCSENYNKDED